MAKLSGTDPGGICIFSGMLLPFLKGKQSTMGRYLSAYHCRPKLNKVTSNMAIHEAREERMGLTCRLCQNIKPISMVRATSFKNEVLELMGRQSPKHPQLVGL